MIRSKTIKKRTKTRMTLLNNLRKGKARKEPRCSFSLIPLPDKLSYPSEVHHLYGDLVLMEFEDKIVTEPCMLNKFKVLKQAHFVAIHGQNTVKVLLENKDVPFTDWKALVEKLEGSEKVAYQEWAPLVRNYCERYERTLREISASHPDDELNPIVKLFKGVQIKAEATRKRFNENYPTLEVRSRIKNGQVEITDICYNEKLLLEVGYTMESFATEIIHGGLPKMIQFKSEVTAQIAKWRLENYLSFQNDGVFSPESIGLLLMKSGFMKRVKTRCQYFPTFENGVFGFSVFTVILAKTEPFLEAVGEGQNLAFVEMMSSQEKECVNFLSTFYSTSMEQRYTNYNKICKVKEI